MDLIKSTNVLWIIVFLQTSYSFIVDGQLSAIVRQWEMGIKNGSYMEQRQRILNKEQLETVGGDIVLTPSELSMNERLLKSKQLEIDLAHYHKAVFAPQINFLNAAPLYEQSDVFQLIKQMPKG